MDNAGERQQLFQSFISEYDHIEERMGELREERKSLRTQIKAEFRLDVFDGVRALMNAAASDVQQFFGALGQALEWVGKPVGYQGEIRFDAAPPAELDIEQQQAVAFQGRAHGLRGGERGDNAFAPGSLGHQCWDEGWLQGQRELAEKLRPTARKQGKRGRPPGVRDSYRRTRRRPNGGDHAEQP